MSTHVALITGASRGLGLEVARAYARRGLRLILTARRAGPLKQAADELMSLTDVVAVAGDVADPAHAEYLVRAGLDRFGQIDALVNNASELGPSPMPELEQLSTQAFEDILRVNVVGPLKLTQLVLPGMRARSSGLIVNVTSDAGVQAYPTWGGYGASKAALEHLSRVLAAELEGSGVRVFVVDPGDMDTAMHRAAEPGVDLSHLPTPDRIAPAFVRLLDEETAFGRFEAQQLLAVAGSEERVVLVAEPEKTLLDFELPSDLEAHVPPEARGLARDQVRLLVSHLADDSVEHRSFRDLPDVLRPGDLVVANDSATLPAALTAHRQDGSQVRLHVSTRLPADLWVVEPRRIAAVEGEELCLPGGATARLLVPYTGSCRLWVARFDTDVPTLLARSGRAIAYPYVHGQWPLEMYQTVYAGPPGSAEMPSAGRAFSPDVLERLAHRGIQFVTLTLHTGVASLEGHEKPYAEEYRVPELTTRAVRLAKADGRRVIAVGTTVVRALESAADEGDGQVIASHAWTELVITPERGVRVVDSLLTGFHEPKASHLAMLEAIAGRRHLEVSYQAALAGRYLWHEFGDLHLILRD